MTERMRLHIQAAEMSVLPRVAEITIRDGRRSLATLEEVCVDAAPPPPPWEEQAEVAVASVSDISWTPLWKSASDDDDYDETMLNH